MVAAAFAQPSSALFAPMRRRLSVEPGAGSRACVGRGWMSSSSSMAVVSLLESGGTGVDGGKKGCGGVPNSNYVVPLDKAAPGIIRPLGEILRDLNKRITDNIVDKVDRSIPWYHINRLLSFYAPGWSGEIRNIVFSDKGTVTVVYRVTVRGSDGEAYRESTGTVSHTDGIAGDPVALAEEMAFCRACARFGLGLYLYHEDETL